MSSSSCDPASWGTAQPITGSMSYHTLATIICGACTGLAVLICIGLAASHLFKFRHPDEQRQIVRIVALPGVISVFSLLSVCFYHISGYLRPIGEYYECLAMVALFLLFIRHATPDEAKTSDAFDSLEVVAANHPGASLPTLYKNWVMVFQILVVRLITLAATLGVSGTECKELAGRSKARTVINVISVLSTIVCLMGILSFYKAVRPSLVACRPIAKLISLKLIVALDVLQSLIFSALSNSGDIKPTKFLTLPDLLIGTPGLMLCAECFLFSLLFLWSFNARPYSASRLAGGQTSASRIGVCGALFHVLNISDVIVGLFNSITAWSGRRADAGYYEGERRGNEPAAMGQYDYRYQRNGGRY